MRRPVSRRAFLGGTALGAAGLLAVRAPGALAQSELTHVVTLSFDDGFRASSLKTTEIYERLSSPLDVVHAQVGQDSRLVCSHLEGRELQDAIDFGQRFLH